MAFELHGRVLFLKGNLLSAEDFPPTPPFLQLEVNLEGVEYINSDGLNAWKKWISKFRSDQIITLTHVPNFFWQRMRLHDGAIPNNSKIESMYVPCYSESLSMEHQALMEVGKNLIITDDSVIVQYDFSQITPAATDWFVDVVDEGYFHFLLEVDLRFKSSQIEQPENKLGIEQEFIEDLKPLWNPKEFEKNVRDMRERIARRIGKDELERLEKVAQKIGIADPQFSKIFVSGDDDSKPTSSRKMFDTLDT